MVDFEARALPKLANEGQIGLRDGLDSVSQQHGDVNYIVSANQHVNGVRGTITVGMGFVNTCTSTKVPNSLVDSVIAAVGCEVRIVKRSARGRI